jgi:hypothetical protein
VSDTIQNAGAAGPDAAGAGIPDSSARVAAAMALMGGEPKSEAAPAAPAAPAEKPTPLSEVIRQQREERKAREAATSKAQTLEQELAKTRSELEKARNSAEFEADPVGYAKSRGWTQEQQLMFGQALLYDLAPDKADPEFRYKMFEAKQAREKAKAEREAQEREAKQATEAQQRQLEDYFQETAAAVRTFEAGSFPESEAWFDGDVNTYMESLMATARNLAAKANAKGEVADLTAPALARALEAEVATRMARRDQRKQPRTAPQVPAQTPAPRAGGTQPPVETLSTRNMHGSAAPLPSATSEKERIQRAIAVGFKSR